MISHAYLKLYPSRLFVLSQAYAPINVNPVGGGGGGVRARGGDLMPGTTPADGFLIVRSDPHMSNIHKRIRFVKLIVHWYQWYDWYQ